MQSKPKADTERTEQPTLRTRGLAPWRGTCPECGGRAVFRVVGRVIIGGCEAGPPCWWAGELDDA